MDEEAIRADERYRMLRDLRMHLIRNAKSQGILDVVGPLLGVVTAQYHAAREATGRPIGDGAMQPDPESKRSRQRRQEKYLRQMLQCTTRAELLTLLEAAEKDGAATQYLVEWTSARAELLERTERR